MSDVLNRRLKGSTILGYTVSVSGVVWVFGSESVPLLNDGQYVAEVHNFLLGRGPGFAGTGDT